MVTLTATFLSIIVDIEWDISRIAASVIFSSGVTLHVVFHSDGWSSNAVVVFVVIGRIVMVSPIKTDWDGTLVSLLALLTCIVRCGKWMTPWVVSMTTLVCFMKCKPIIGLVRFFITTKCSANVLSPISNSSVVVANGFSNWPSANFFENWDGRPFRRWYLGLVSFCPINLRRLHWHKLLSLLGWLF